MLLLLNGLNAQQPDTFQVPDSAEGGDEMPRVLKELVEQYKHKVAKDSSLKQEPDTQQEGPALNNLVLDKTLSNIGRDFYDFFSENWNPPETERNFIIYIYERPAPGIGNIVQIEINHEKVFESRLTPRRQILQKVARQAVNKSTNYIANYKEINQQLGKDLEGSGIY